jgi:SAM-dependent methyltransferase
MSDVDSFANANDVAMCYRYFLHREPENSAIVKVHLGNKPTVWQLIQAFLESREHETAGIDDGCMGIWRQQDGRGVRVESSEPANAAILEHVQKIWSAYGIDDPYYSVLTNTAYQANNITNALTEQFYQSGIEDVANFTLACERNRIEIDPRWHILDLGCGVGRIGEHFCKYFEYYYGVDISKEHLNHAMNRLNTTHIRNASLMLLDDALEGNIDFDVFYSMITLQHNPPPIIYYLLDKFLAKLKPRGLAFFQVPCHLYDYEFDVERYLAGQGKSDRMEMHALPHRYVFEVLHKRGLQPIEVWPFPVIGPIGISYVFFARKGSPTVGNTNRSITSVSE